jgi:hypothetical protein
MNRCRALVATVALCVFAAVAGPAMASDEPPVADRVQADVEPEADESGAEVQVDGELGAVGFAGGAEADEDGARVTSAPWYEAVGTDGKRREELYGPPGAAAALGTGGLTASFTAAGVLSNLSWPGPGFYDHVNYVQVSRDWQNHGAPENAGSFGGLVLPDGTATWFTPGDGWTKVEQTYAGPESGVVRTVLQRPATDGIPELTVTIRDVVHPSDDVLARSFDVVGAPDGSDLLYYANMNPTTTRTPRLPSTTEGAADNASDFATEFLRDRNSMVHFRPATIDPTATTVAATGRIGAENTEAALAGTTGDGVYIAVRGDRDAIEHQAGLETLGMVRDEAESTALLDPFYDARDGSLSGADLAIGKTAGAQRWEGTEATVYLSAAPSAEAALDGAERARDLGFHRIAQEADRDWRDWIGRARLPPTGDEHIDAVNKRALMLIRTAQDRRTGAIVANTTVQTPYRQDWVRDGAFFNYALLTAGYPEMVAAHNDFYRRAQSETGHWSPILCTDGAHCDAVFPFEIDAQGLGVWIQWMEYEFDGNAAALAERYDSIARGAEILFACQDPTNGMQCYAAEDDAVEPTQKAQGAATVYLGLRSAADAARVVAGIDPSRAASLNGDADRWDARADDLQVAVLEHWCTKTKDGTDARDCGIGRGVVYLVWPGKVLTDVSPEMDDQYEVSEKREGSLERFRSQLRTRMDQMEPGEFFQYPMESMMALTNGGSDRQAQLHLDAIDWLGNEVAEPGVLHFGERIYYLGGQGADTDYLHSVGFPHVWSGAEMYLSSAMVHGLDGCHPGSSFGDIPCAVGANGAGTPAR